jgi:hypothetical protein
LNAPLSCIPSPTVTETAESVASTSTDLATSFIAEWKHAA